MGKGPVCANKKLVQVLHAPEKTSGSAETRGGEGGGSFEPELNTLSGCNNFGDVLSKML